MKNIIITLCLSISLTSQAQITPLLDHVWQLEKMIIDNEETLAEPDYDASDDAWVKIDFDTMGFLFVGLIPDLIYNDENSSFTINDMATNFGSYHFAEATGLFEIPFIANEDVFIDWNNPFTYSFRYEGDLIFLDITNSNDDVAIFYATTLSNTNFENVEFSLYPNPTTNILHIETTQEDIKTVEIFNLQGKRVLQTNTREVKSIEVSALNNGVYFVKLSTNQGEITKKFVKK